MHRGTENKIKSHNKLVEMIENTKKSHSVFLSEVGPDRPTTANLFFLLGLLSEELDFIKTGSPGPARFSVYTLNNLSCC